MAEIPQKTEEAGQKIREAACSGLAKSRRSDSSSLSSDAEADFMGRIPEEHDNAEWRQMEEEEAYTNSSSKKSGSRAKRKRDIELIQERGNESLRLINQLLEYQQQQQHEDTMRMQCRKQEWQEMSDNRRLGIEERLLDLESKKVDTERMNAENMRVMLQMMQNRPNH